MLDFKLEEVRRRFPRFTLETPRVDGPFFIDCLGGRTRRRYFSERRDMGPVGVLNLFAPSAFEEYFEWVDLLESVHAAGDVFTMVELGAGFGRWVVLGAVAARSVGKRVGTLSAVEAEPAHYAWTRQQFVDNGLDPAEHRIVHAAVGAHEGSCHFYTGCADTWWGQSVAAGVSRNTPRLRRVLDRALRRERVMGTVETVPCVTLSAVLRPYDAVDLVHCDIQGSELDVVEASIDVLTLKVRTLMVATHPPFVAGTGGRDVEPRLREILTAHGWRCTRDIPTQGKDVAVDGHRTDVDDGLQTWRNPRIVGSHR